MRRWLWIPLAASALGIGLSLSLQTPQPKKDQCLGQFATSLVERTRSQRYNARLALDSLDGAVLKPGDEFSFNKRVGTWSRDAGYRKAPVSFGGQLVTSWGGGVCQTSSTLYNAALLSGMEIVERHRHAHAPGYCPPGRDAAVAFHGIDLRFRNPYAFPVKIRAEWTGNRLSVGIYGREMPDLKPQILTQIRESFSPGTLVLKGDGDFGRVRNTGKAGFEVSTYRIVGNRRELLSVDSYPPMTRIVQLGQDMPLP